MKQQKPKQEVKYDIDEYRKKRKRKKRRSALLSVFTFLVLMVVVVGGLYLYRNYDMDEILEFIYPQDEGGTLSRSSFPIAVDGISPEGLYSSEKMVVLLTNEEVALISSDGDVTHNFTHQYTNAQVKTAGERTLTYDKGGHSYRIDSSSSHLQDGKTDGVILTGAIAPDGSYAVVTTESNFAGSIRIFDRSHREILEWYSASDQIVDLSFSKDGDYLAVACAGFSDGVLISKLYLLEVYGGEEAELGHRSFPNALPLEVSFLENGHIHMICDNLLVTANRDFSEVESSTLNGEIAELYVSPRRTILLLQNAGQAAGTLLLVSKDGEQKTTLINGEIYDVADSDEYIALLLKHNVFYYDDTLSQTDGKSLSDDVFDIAAIGENLYTLSPSYLKDLPLTEE